VIIVLLIRILAASVKLPQFAIVFQAKETPLNIVFASSEVAPLAKTGGLADVCGALPAELTRMGHQVCVFMPAFRQTKQYAGDLECTDITFDIPISGRIVSGRLLKTSLPDGVTPVYLVQNDDYYDRNELYRENGEDYSDNCERFVFFCRAVLEAIRSLELDVDVINANDWQTGLIPAYLKTDYAEARGYQQIASVITIHNIEYQGLFWHWDMPVTGLDWKYFNHQQMEYYGQLNLLKTGLVFADAINTVSPRYAQEIQTPERGCGLEGVLQQRADVLAGILNGVDYSVWNPADDEHIAANYTAENWQQGKPVCKAALQQKFNLPVEPDTPVIGLVGRLASQKGWDLVMEVMRQWLEEEHVQWVVLGSGEQHYHDQLSELADRYPSKVGLNLGFSEEDAHQIEAGCDMFVMASQYEPCGLNQMYSLKYGAVPVVRETGGLANTVVDTTPETLASGAANGFSFADFNPGALAGALHHALHVYREQPDDWKRLVDTGMNEDRSWGRSAQRYLELYEQISERKRAGLEG